MNTKQDYVNLQPTNEGKKLLQQLLDSRYIWTSTAVLNSKESGVEDDTHRIVEDENSYLQQEYVEDSNAQIFRLGFTVEEVEKLIKG